MCFLVGPAGAYQVLSDIVTREMKGSALLASESAAIQVVTSQTAALANERNDIDLMRRRLEANVLLIKAIGRGWDI
jgi:outer membrane protein TolC